MRLTTKARFAVTAMLDLALHSQNGPVRLSSIADRQKISLSYLEQLFAKLRRSALVDSVRGPGGGYNLSRSTDQLSVADIILAVEEPIDSRQCAGKENCLGIAAADGKSGAKISHSRCMTHDLWESLNDNVIQFLSDVNLAQLVQQQHIERQQQVQLVHIAPNMLKTSKAQVGGAKYRVTPQ